MYYLHIDKLFKQTGRSCSYLDIADWQWFKSEFGHCSNHLPHWHVYVWEYDFVIKYWQHKFITFFYWLVIWLEPLGHPIPFTKSGSPGDIIKQCNCLCILWFILQLQKDESMCMSELLKTSSFWLWANLHSSRTFVNLTCIFSTGYLI